MMQIHKIIVSDSVQAAKIVSTLVTSSCCDYKLEQHPTAFKITILHNPKPDDLVNLLYSLQLQEDIWLVSTEGLRRHLREL